MYALKLTACLIVIGVTVAYLTNVLERANQTPQTPYVLEPGPGLQEPTIQPSDFEIVSYRSEWERGRLRSRGELRNNGSVRGGAQIEVIARDAQGQLIDSQQFWPNSIYNILPGDSCGFEYTITTNPRAERLEIKIISARTW